MAHSRHARVARPTFDGSFLTMPRRVGPSGTSADAATTVDASLERAASRRRAHLARSRARPTASAATARDASTEPLASTDAFGVLSHRCRPGLFGHSLD